MLCRGADLHLDYKNRQQRNLNTPIKPKNTKNVGFWIGSMILNIFCSTHIIDFWDPTFNHTLGLLFESEANSVHSS